MTSEDSKLLPAWKERSAVCCRLLAAAALLDAVTSSMLLLPIATALQRAGRELCIALRAGLARISLSKDMAGSGRCHL